MPSIPRRRNVKSGSSRVDVGVERASGARLAPAAYARMDVPVARSRSRRESRGMEDPGLDLAVDAVVAEAVAARLGEECQPVRATPYPDAPDDMPRTCVDHADRVAEAVRRPQAATVRRHLEHVRASADTPGGDDPSAGEADHRDRAREPVGHVEVARVAADGEAVGTLSRGNEADDVEGS